MVVTGCPTPELREARVSNHPVQKGRRLQILVTPADEDVAILQTVLRYIRERVTLARDLAQEMEMRRGRKPGAGRRRSRAA
jgi:hypothetical protein